MDLKQLKTFILVAETGSLSRASDRLRLAQPALSRHIKLLEQEVGLTLFVRHGRGMDLTEVGREFLDRISGLVFQLEKSVDDVRSFSADPRGRVTLGLMPTISHILASRIARRVAEDLPHVSLRIVEGLTGHLIDWLQRGEIDTSLLPGPGADLHLRTTDLLYEEFLLVGPSDAPLSPDRPIAVADLRDMKLILPSHPHGQRHLIESAADRAHVKLQIRFEADSLSLMLSLVEAGLGYTVLPMSAIYHEVAVGRFVVAPLHSPAVRRQLILALPNNRADTRATTAVNEVVVREIAALVRSGLWKASADSSLLSVSQPH